MNAPHLRPSPLGSTLLRGSNALIAGVMILLLASSGCAFFRSAETPMAAVDHPAAGDAQTSSLVVFLPGFGDEPEDFLDNGFVDVVASLERPYYVTATDAHFGYYRGFTVIERLRQDIILPARAQGYTDIWLVGVSMGGFGALSYAMLHGDEIAGVIALAPYLGDGDVIDEVLEADSLEHWEPPADMDRIDDAETRHSYRLWTFFKGLPSALGTTPEIHLAWGIDDRVDAPANALAAALPEGHVRSAPGGHSWTVWRPLFGEVAAQALDAPRTASGAR